jgi:hypothetical protein
MRASDLPSGDPSVFDASGSPLAVDPTLLKGPASLLVRPVTDALKVVEAGLVSGVADRAGVGAVAGLSLARGVVDRLGDGDFTLDGLMRRVVELGHGWDVVSWSPTDVP